MGYMSVKGGGYRWGIVREATRGERTLEFGGGGCRENLTLGRRSEKPVVAIFWHQNAVGK